MRTKDREARKVTVFGAGIAGLTAAHELVTRGYLVEVIDPAINEEVGDHTLDRGIGGMARSQWVCEVVTSESQMYRLWPSTDLALDKTIVFDAGTPIDPEYAKSVLDAIAAAIGRLKTAGMPLNTMILMAPVENAIPSGDPRIPYVMKELKQRGIAQSDLDQLQIEQPSLPEQPNQWQWLFVDTTFSKMPAEHGFRFFPSFYRHLFDTMKRTPIINPRDFERGRTCVYDNLISSEVLGFARANKKPSFSIPRRPIGSYELMREYLDLVLDNLNYTMSDVARFQLKLFKYMTSCRRRRLREYETTSWGAFVEENKYSPDSRRHIENGPQMSAALRGSQSDARTQGNITVQLLLDNIQAGPLCDGTLEGPTSGTWFNHWYDFLVGEGVTFRRGYISGFRRDRDRVLPVVHTRTRFHRKDEPPRVHTHGHYFVLALSLPAIYDLADSFIHEAGIDEHDVSNDWVRIKRFAGPDLHGDLQKDTPDGPLQHLSGIQYYFEGDVRFWRGHTQYLDSEWGLTSIAQPQFWARPRQLGDGYRGLLSVDIGSWDREYKGTTAWAARSADQLAGYGWEQIRAHHETAYRQQYGDRVAFPTPFAYALDYNISFTSPKGDGTPFLVNRTGKYKGRPGAIEEKHHEKTPLIEDRRRLCESRYSLHADRYVIAGTFMQTYTRLTSMEGANESARHAVNRLLAEWHAQSEPCLIWDPEDHELPDLQWLKELDEQLLDRHLPHFVDILGWEYVPDHLLMHHHLHHLAHAARS
ncbi:MAG: hypothetical protein ACM31C_27205 [Acidobacteriota bacterium]